MNRNAWIVTGTLGIIGFGATVAAANDVIGDSLETNLGPALTVPDSPTAQPSPSSTPGDFVLNSAVTLPSVQSASSTPSPSAPSVSPPSVESVSPPSVESVSPPSAETPQSPQSAASSD